MDFVLEMIGTRFSKLPKNVSKRMIVDGSTHSLDKAKAVGDYFYSWKRKLGVVTLVMACLFAAAWVRSLSVADVFGYWNNEVKSASGAVYWTHGVLVAATGPSHQIVDLADVQDWYYDFPEMWSLRFFGLGAGSTKIEVDSLNGNTSIITAKYLRVPYGPLTFFPTLFATFLLLSKPRKMPSVPQTGVRS